MVVMPSVAGADGPSVFINEIHYDNAGTDAGEAFEIAGPAGTDLAGWSVVLYNGSNGAVLQHDCALRDDPEPAGRLRHALLPAENGIQNGAPDGMALVDAGSNVVEFLSYEGTFTAVGGPANGMTSTDIGVSEPSSTPVGDSLQLTGAARWVATSRGLPHRLITFGDVNAGQTFTGAPDHLPAIS